MSHTFIFKNISKKNKMIKPILILILLFFTTVSSSQNKNPKENSKPFVLGSIEEIQSKVLSEKRILNIYLPEGYQQNDITSSYF